MCDYISFRLAPCLHTRALQFVEAFPGSQADACIAVKVIVAGITSGTKISGVLYNLQEKIYTMFAAPTTSIKLKCGAFNPQTDTKLKLNIKAQFDGALIENFWKLFAAEGITPSVFSAMFIQEYATPAKAEEMSKIIMTDTPEEHRFKLLKKEAGLKCKVEGKKLVLSIEVPITEEELKRCAPIDVAGEYALSTNLTLLSPITGSEFFKGSQAAFPVLALLRAFSLVLTTNNKPGMMGALIKCFGKAESPLNDVDLQMDLEVDTYEELPPFVKLFIMRPLDKFGKFPELFKMTFPMWQTLKDAESGWRLVLYLNGRMGIDIEGCFPGATEAL